ncbi:MAG: undecaprenyl-diphosphate phosphatase [Clostridiales bacterium]|nr:undecaprenyl-diphosphate phosphatase [Clostridiales bacterium]
MNIVQSIILGIIQGLTEFLPVSSSGHLVLLQRLFGISESTLLFNIAVHFATLISVIIVFWSEIVKIIKKPICKMSGLIFISMVPAVIVGILFKDFFENLNNSGISLGIGFFITGIVLLITSKIKIGKSDITNMKWYDALLIGLAQAIAIIPGISRSGMTMATSLSRKLKKELAIKFAFLMSIPVIAGGFILELYDVYKEGIGSIEILPIVIGMVFAGLFGFFAIQLFVKLVMKGKLHYFAYYVFALSLFVFIDQLFIGHFFERIF